MSEKNREDQRWVFTPDIKTPISVKSEEQFLSGNHLFTAILESIQDGVSVLSADLCIRYMNAYMKYWYFKKEDALGKHCYQIYHNRKTPCKNCPTLASIKTRQPQVDLVRYTRDGKDFGWQQLYAVPILNPEGDVILVIEYIRDITFQKVMEENLKNLETRFAGLEQQNTLLLNALDARAQQTEALEATISENVEKYIRPSLNYLKHRVDEQDVDMVSSVLERIVYPITKKRENKISTLTPRELQVAAMIKEGSTSKEIADKLCITKKAVDYHRLNIRKKLKLQRNVNLQVYLEANL